MARVLVVGGGIAGLTCAWRLQQAGHLVEVFEREAVAGGRMRSERRGEFVLDRGAQFIASGYRNLHALVAELGLADSVRSLGRTSNAILRDGRLESGDYGSPLAFVRSRLLSTGAKIRLPRILYELWRRRHLLDPRSPELAAAIDHEAMPEFLRRVVGDEAFEYVFAPAFSSTFDSDPEDLSAAFVLLALRFIQSGFRLQSFVGGTGRLTAALAERLRIRSNCEVTAVRTDKHAAYVEVIQNGRRSQQQGDAVVVAVPGSLVKTICDSLTAAEASFFGDVRYVRGIIVFLMTATALPTLPYYGVAFPRREGLKLYGLAVDHFKPQVAPPGAGLLNAALTATAANEMWGRSDDDIAAMVLSEIARTPIGQLDPMDVAVHRWQPMLPQFYAGYLPRLASFLNRRERSPRLAFAGDYLVGPYTEAALTSGLRAADSVRAFLCP